MATAAYIVEKALRKIRIIASEEPIEASMIQDGIDSLNDMLSTWEPVVQLGFVTVENQGDEVRIPRQAVSAVYNNLAVEIAPEYGVTVPDSLAVIASNAKSMLYLSLIDLTVSFPDTLPKGSGNRDYCYDYLDDEFFPQNNEQNF